MKRLTLFTFLMLAAAVPLLAQEKPDLIVLNDATPAIDVAIALPPDTTGTISLNIAQAAVTLTDASGATVFSAADGRLHALELNIAPNSGNHTLTVGRLPGVAEASVSVISLPEPTINGAVTLVEGDALTLNEEIAITLNPSAPGGTATVNIPEGTTGVLTTTFPGASASTQLIDADGQLIAQSTGGHIDALSVVLDAGQYDFTILSSNLSSPIVAGIRAVSSEDGGFTVIDAPATPVLAADTAVASSGENCTATVSTNSVNLRTGPGTGYTVLDYAYRGEVFAVGGKNPESNWVVIGTDTGSAWMSLENAQLQGACDALTIFNIPLQDAVPAQVIITSPHQSGRFEDYYI
jgi:hypothetical protein